MEERKFSEQELVRREKLQELIDKGIDPFGQRFDVTAYSKEIKEKYGLTLTPKFDITVSKSDSHSIEMINEISDLVKSEEDYMSVTFALAPTEAVRNLIKRMDELIADIQALENEQLELQQFRVGEAYAEVVLEEAFVCRFHWNENRDVLLLWSFPGSYDLPARVHCLSVYRPPLCSPRLI